MNTRRPIQQGSIGDQLVRRQRSKYRETLAGSVTVPANSESILEVKISNLGAFELQKITGSYETLSLIGGNITDDGVCYTSVHIMDGANSLPLTNDFIDTDILFSPGRVRSANATNNLTTAEPTGFLFFPLEFHYVFAALSSIQFRVRNRSNTPIKFNCAFHGMRIRG